MIRPALLLLPGIWLAACGGGGGGGGGGGPLPPPTTYVGDWMRGLCVPIGANSTRNRLTVTWLGDNTVGYAEGVVQYANTGCSGDWSPAGGSTALGTIVFGATERSGAVTFNRGTWTLPPEAGGDVRRLIWALNADGRLCGVVDTEPTLFPTAASVAAYFNAVSNDFCYRYDPA